MTKIKEFSVVAFVSFTYWIHFGLACIATTPGSTPSIITTTAATTLACNTCTVGQITFTGMTTPDTEPSTFEGPNTGADGCLSLTAICGQNPNAGLPVFMQFNGNQGGPQSADGTEVQATLNCVDGNWVFAPAGEQSRIITEVNCVIVTP